jgi:hypothetical protein
METRFSIEKLVKLINKNYPKDASKDAPTYTISENSTDTAIIQMLSNEFSNSRFTLSQDIIYPFINNTTSTHVKIEYGNITLNCIAPYEDVPPSFFLLRIVRRLICIIKIFNINKSFTIWLLPIKYNRFFPNGSIVAPKNINGGYTYQNGTTIYVYRYEECAKVLIHEILHHSIFDTHLKWPHNHTEHIRTICSIDKTIDLNINEAIIEFWAILLECLFVSYEYDMPYKMLLQKERDWSLKQSIKLLQYQKKYFPVWKEETNAYCYIVLKSVLLINSERFMNIKVPYSTEILTQFISQHIIALFKLSNV